MQPAGNDPAARAFALQAVQDYSGELHRFLRRRVADAQDLGDLVQEVYLRLLRVQNLESVRNPLAYIYGIAGHVASEFNMRQRQGRLVFDSTVVEAVADNPGQAGFDEGGAFFERQVGDALAQLAPSRLAVLLLERREGLSHAQIAARLGLSVHTVKKYSVEALAHVRASLER
ncbi:MULTISPECIES: RNA polymerase sigma factor [Stenotrophomonas]|uniref:RNA polymerase sigma factor n=1 Tax=Stenotrophomonas TaxID=40323 RepID=UPI0006FB7DC6|nr:MULTISPECIES: RNA polymerase sigma factor [Stenotrophomonas]KQN97245.1 hypothetical protein ASF01_12355 [Stenotrophomonas sp. Leaf70]MBN8792696.1 RNA polymerase sigma factor [Stenotrophomonas nitritireducens]MBN8797456.1 RNA polymerase sigma factor [Stenotrophomonas nitritireducens]